MHTPFTQSWADTFHDAINANAAYRDVSGGWSWPVALVLDNGAPVGLVGPVAMELTLERGVCHTARTMSPDAVTAPFVLRAPYDVWKQIIRGTLDPVSAIVKGQIAFTGQLTTLMLHAKSAVALVQCAQAVPTRFPDEET